MRKILNNKPLVEAIFELRWVLPQGGIDPNYKFILGKVHDQIQEIYPFYEPLPTSQIPEELIRYNVQHRFRASENKWPLIQLGPGIITLNDTDGYVWEDFIKRVGSLLTVFFQSYPSKNELKIKALQIRYIDSIGFSFNQERVLDFLRDKMKIDISLYKSLFDGTGVVESPIGLDLRFSFESNKPPGNIQMRFARGQKDTDDIIFWETILETNTHSVPQDKETINQWIVDAHFLTDDWFFKIIEGDLERRFE